MGGGTSGAEGQTVQPRGRTSPSFRRTTSQDVGRERNAVTPTKLRRRLSEDMKDLHIREGNDDENYGASGTPSHGQEQGKQGSTSKSMKRSHRQLMEKKDQGQSWTKYLLPLLFTAAQEGVFALAWAVSPSETIFPTLQISGPPMPQETVAMTRRLFGPDIAVRCIPDVPTPKFFVEKQVKKALAKAEQRVEILPPSSQEEQWWKQERAVRMKQWDEIQEEKSKRWVEILSVKGIATGGRLSKSTFQLLSPRYNHQAMKSLMHPFDEQAPVAVSSTEMCSYAQQYYQDILTSRRRPEELTTNQDNLIDLWEVVDARLPRVGQLDLDRPITEMEVRQALKDMARGNAPGSDGLTVEYYSMFWSELEAPLIKFYNDILTDGKSWLAKVNRRGKLEMCSWFKEDTSVLLSCLSSALFDWKCCAGIGKRERQNSWRKESGGEEGEAGRGRSKRERQGIRHVFCLRSMNAALSGGAWLFLSGDFGVVLRLPREKPEIQSAFTGTDVAIPRRPQRRYRYDGARTGELASVPTSGAAGMDTRSSLSLSLSLSHGDCVSREWCSTSASTSSAACATRRCGRGRSASDRLVCNHWKRGRFGRLSAIVRKRACDSSLVEKEGSVQETVAAGFLSGPSTRGSQVSGSCQHGGFSQLAASRKAHSVTCEMVIRGLLSREEDWLLPRGVFRRCAPIKGRASAAADAAAASGWEPGSAVTASSADSISETVEEEESVSIAENVSKFRDAFWRFLRPHTIRGTLLGTTAVVVRALMENSHAINWALTPRALRGLLALLCGNGYIVGINQIYDVSIDKVNKPFLPVAAGDLSPAWAWALCLLLSAVGIGIVATNFGRLITALYCTGLLLGTIYSVPPFRLKQNPLWAFLIIAFVRGVLLNFGVYYATRAALGLQFAWSPSVAFITVFVTLFATAIAITKDLPDVEGDRQFNIATFATRLGVPTISMIGTGIILCNYVGAIALALSMPATFNLPVMIGGHVLLALSLSYNAWKLAKAGYAKPAILAFYRFIWNLFYGEYIMFPFI
ncbi:hypothetical protein CBR_g34665 [Chara braunii]|uniref:Homogentisate phytyltransferase n=1 Tax=Chara braunii TaxID=69332 RepID=A0A388JYW9_CHABU|nr:hypothetical protein CBR_g34665 [Chara braunii]|eukprot:GBG62965.1 hypothetical protein CBR_g34665 [Chara braunii]